jgi:hypothetical protein
MSGLRGERARVDGTDHLAHHPRRLVIDVRLPASTFRTAGVARPHATYVRLRA